MGYHTNTPMLSPDDHNSTIYNKANRRDLIATSSLVILLKFDSNQLLAHLSLKFGGWPRKIRGHPFYATSSIVQYFKAIGKFKLRSQPQTPDTVQNWLFFIPCDLEIWWMALKKKIGHLSYATARFVHHFITIIEFKLELQTGNTQFRSKSAPFRPCDLEIWWMTKNNKAFLLCYFKLCATFDSHQWLQFSLQSENAQFREKSAIFAPSDLEISQMTLKKQRTPLIRYFKLCASFHSHRWIQTWVAVRKRPIWIKICNFLSRVTLKFARWPLKPTGQLICVIASFVHHFLAMRGFKLELWSGNAQIGANIFGPLWPWPLISDPDLLHRHHFCQWQ